MNPFCIIRALPLGVHMRASNSLFFGNFQMPLKPREFTEDALGNIVDQASLVTWTSSLDFVDGVQYYAYLSGAGLKRI